MKKDNIHKKIDVVVKYFYPVTAGIETNIMETYSRLAKKGWDITIHTSKDTYKEKDILPNYEIINGLKITRYHFGTFGFFPNIDWENTSAVCLHNFDIFPHFRILFFTLINKLFGLKNFIVFLTPHGGFNPEWTVFNKVQAIIKFLYSYTLGTLLINATVDGIRAVSEWEMLEMIKKGLLKNKIRLISNGIQDEAYVSKESEISKEFKSFVKNQGKYLIQIGRIYPIKNQIMTIKALPKIPDDIKLLLVGPIQDNKYKNKLDNIINKLNLSNRVVFTGVINGPDKYYLIKNAIAMVHMAVWEANCNVIHEAMSQNLLCIVAKSTGMQFQIKNNENGFILPLHDVSKLADTINFVVNNKGSSELKSMTAKNLEYVNSHSWEKVAERMENFYIEHVSTLIPNPDISLVSKYFYPIKGGIEDSLKYIYTHNDFRKYKIKIYTSYVKQNDALKESKPESIEIHRYGGFSYRLPKEMFNTKIMNLQNFLLVPHTIILTITFIHQLFGVKRYKLLLTPHGGLNPNWEIFPFYQKFFKKLTNKIVGIKLINKTIDKVIAVSEWEKIQLINLGVNQSKISIVPNPIVPNKEGIKQNQLSENLKGMKPYAIQIGKIYPTKNYELSIKAFANLHDLNLIILGEIIDKRYYDKLKNLIKDLGLTNNIRFITAKLPRHEKIQLHEQAVVQIHTAKWENFGLAVYEGLSLGVIQIVTNSGNLPYAVNDGINGFVCNDNYKDLTNIIEYTSHNIQSEKLKIIKNNNIEQGKNLNLDNIVSKYTQLYESLK